MNKYRPAVVALAACAAGLSLTACSSGSTTTATATTASATPSHSATTSASVSASVSASASTPAGSEPAGRTLQVSGVKGGFPVPAGAKVAENIGGGQEIVVIFALVAPAKVSSFYAQVLPRAGYTISSNSVISQGGTTAAIIQFAGHGFAGNIDALSKFNDSSVSIAGLGHKNVTTVTFTPK